MNILIPDLLKDTFLEKKILGKKYNIFLRRASEFNNLNDKFLSKIDGVMTGHHVVFDSKKIKSRPVYPVAPITAILSFFLDIESYNILQ